jgi:NADH-quinone oxidoreductase subunit L
MRPDLLPTLLGLAWLVPLVSFTLILFFGPRMGKHGIGAGYVATGAIVFSAILSQISLFGIWLPHHPLPQLAQHHAGAHQSAGHEESHTSDSDHVGHESAGHETADHAETSVSPHYNGDWYVLGQFGQLRITIGYYIDTLTVVMFAMVTFIASCIHFYAQGYMHDELHDITDHEVTLSNGEHLHRPGRYHRFFQYLSLFCFSMLGIVISGNIAMVFVFWELVGICSYFLIGFYIERKSASNAANKAFIVNRVGDFGMIIGLMALLGALGTFSFGDYLDADGKTQPGLFSLVRPADRGHALGVPDGILLNVDGERIVAEAVTKGEGVEAGRKQIREQVPALQRDLITAGPLTGSAKKAYWLLVVAGLGIFCGCVGKSAQFPLHVWLPDAMEGPTPVSALVHSATMVAAGVYLVGRFYPVFAPEVLLVIAIIGCITLFLAATIAITAVDIKRVLAYSTVSQLGYMMLALGVGGWVAGMMHLITHAFFKSLLFMCSGSVIHAVHTNDMTKMGGLRHKMPWTAYTMLVGCLAIAGAGIPFIIGFSGYYSKDAIIAQAMSFTAQGANPVYAWLLYAACGGAAITAFYMFRLWYMTFAGEPRDHHAYDHAHESPKVMYYPLVVLAVLAVCVAWPIFGLERMLEQARPAGTLASMSGHLLPALTYTSEHNAHNFHDAATYVAFSTALFGFLLATVFYGWKWLSAAEVKKQFAPLHKFLWNKWYFDELYNGVFVQPTHFVARRVSQFDKNVLDWLIDRTAVVVRSVASFDDLLDRFLVDGIVNAIARWTHRIAIWLRTFQSGLLRRYVMLIVVGLVALFVLMSFYLDYSLAGPPKP